MLLHDPGERWTYGASTKVLGDLAATVSGRPLEDLLRTGIFELFWVDPVRRVAVVLLMQLVPFHDPAALRVVEGVEAIVYRRLAD